MSKDYEGVTPESAVAATMHRHLVFLREGLMRIQHELERRGLVHDNSKYSSEEFPGFARINATARQHPYGSQEYKDSLNAERPTIDHHMKENSHHPEYFEFNGMTLEDMDWLDIVEMVCDWWSANQTYGKQTPWADNMKIQEKRFDWSPEQWWLINQVSDFLTQGEE
jgi:hypothetical protein